MILGVLQFHHVHVLGVALFKAPVFIAHRKVETLVLSCDK